MLPSKRYLRIVDLIVCDRFSSKKQQLLREPTEICKTVHNYSPRSYSLTERAKPENSVVQCGQRVALIGIVIAQAGHSFETGVFESRFSLLIARTSRKTAPATIRKLMSSVTKLP
jgi:hypothetical protein